MAALRVSLEEEGPECSLESRVLEGLEGELKMARQNIFQKAPPPSQPHPPPQPHCPGTAQLAVPAPAEAN